MADGKAPRMRALPSADLAVPQASLMHGGPPDLVTVPCPTYLIEHEKGLVLFDTGCRPAVAGGPVAHWGSFAEHLSYPKELLLDREIQALGYKMSDMKYVLPSICISTIRAICSLFPRRPSSSCRTNCATPTGRIPTCVMCLRSRTLCSRGAFLGDGSLQMLKTPGHTPGESSLHVRLPNRSILLVGDMFRLRERFNTLSGVPLDTDPAPRRCPANACGPFETCTSVRSGSRTTRKPGMNYPTCQLPLSKGDVSAGPSTNIITPLWPCL